MSLALAILLVGILDRDLLVHEVLTVHIGDGIVRSIEGGKGEESVTLGVVGLVAGDLDDLLG